MAAGLLGKKRGQLPNSALCPKCGRRVGLRPKGQTQVLRVHHRPGGGRCAGSGREAEPEDEARALAEDAAALDPGERPTWEHALAVYEKTAVTRTGKRLAARTLKKYRPHLRAFAAWCRANEIETPPDLTFETLRAYHGRVVREHVSARDAQAVAAVRSLARWAGEHWPAHLPSARRIARACPMVKVQSVSHPVLSTADSQALGRYLERITEAGDIEELKDAACVVLAGYAGLRRAEIVRLDLADLEERPDYWLLHVLGKGEKRRDVPLHPSVAAILRRYLELTDRAPGGDGPVIVPRNGRETRRLRGSAVYDAVKRAQKAARLSRPVTPHGLRSTFALQFLRGSQGDLQALQKLLGHSAPETTMRYAAHVLTERIAPHLPGIGYHIEGDAP